MHRVVVRRAPTLAPLFQRHSVAGTRFGLAHARKTSTSTSAMATPYKVKVTPEDTGLLKVVQALTPEAAGKVTELLQEDLDVSFGLCCCEVVR